MAPTDDELNLLVSMFLLLFSRRLTTDVLAYLFLRRARRGRIQFRVLQTLRVLYLLCRHRRQLAARRRPRTAWVFPRPQNWFQGLLNNQALEFWWIENFRVSRETFDHICRLVGPNLQRQDTRLREAIPVPKRVAVRKGEIERELLTLQHENQPYFQSSSFASTHSTIGAKKNSNHSGHQNSFQTACQRRLLFCVVVG